MKKLYRLAALVAAFLLLGCAVQKQWTPVGGSRSDGTVELAYEYGMFQKPQLSDAQGAQAAAATCANWGYESAQPFGGSTRTCEVMTSDGCSQWLVKKKYQCLGAPAVGQHVARP